MRAEAGLASRARKIKTSATTQPLMIVDNENVPFEFYREFEQLVRNSTLRGRAGTIVLSSDWATLHTWATFRSLDPNVSPQLLAKARSPHELFAKILGAIEPAPMPSSLPQALKHPGPGHWWWLCFCDTDKPENHQFLGVTVVEGTTLREAMELATSLGINPGGRVASVACTRFVPAPRWRNRLLTREEVIAAGNDMEAAEKIG